MKLNVPFYKQTNKTNCGVFALKMVLAYFGKDESAETLEKRTGIKEGKGLSTIQLATASALSGFKTELYSKYIEFNKENLKKEFYQKYLNLESESEELIKKAKEAGVNLEEKTLSLNEILKLITEDSIPIILIDWSVIKNKENYHGHFVPIVGYDEKNVYIHNHGLNYTQEFMPIPKETFDKARKSEGTDEDILIIYRNN